MLAAKESELSPTAFFNWLCTVSFARNNLNESNFDVVFSNCEFDVDILFNLNE